MFMCLRRIVVKQQEKFIQHKFKLTRMCASHQNIEVYLSLNVLNEFLTFLAKYIYFVSRQNMLYISIPHIL